MTAAVTVDVAGAQMGGAARFSAEMHRYLRRTGRQDIHVIGAARCVDSAWLVRRELARQSRGRRVALNNVSFVAPGSERWTLLRNALHFLTDDESARLDRSLRAATMRQAAVIRLAARRADVLVVPSTAMADRVPRILPSVRTRSVIRPQPVSADAVPRLPRDSAILCPVLFAPYKQMTQRLTELLAAIEDYPDVSVRVRVTADHRDVAPALACSPRIEFVGQLDQHELRQLWGRSRAIYFPTDLESFGYPLADARGSGQPVVGRETEQNREIAGPALCGFVSGDITSLQHAIERALTTEPVPDPAPFDPDAYFHWLLGPQR